MSAISDYQTSLEALKSATAEAERIARIVSSGAASLSKWREGMVSDVPGGFPAEIALNPRSPRIGGREWPTAQMIADSLQRYHSAVADVRTKYAAIPETERGVVTSPQSIIRPN